MSKFTKGPWTTEHTIREKYHLGQIRKADSAHIIVGNGLPLAELHLGNVNANAHLIAAAPEMYEEIESLIGCIDLMLKGTVNADDIDAVLRYAKQVLAKARGEQ